MRQKGHLLAKQNKIPNTLMDSVYEILTRLFCSALL